MIGDANTTEHGRDLVESAADPPAMLDRLAMCAYHRQQRERAELTGRCAGGCSISDLVNLPNGRLVCFRTLDPCPMFALGSVLELWSALNARRKA